MLALEHAKSSIKVLSSFNHLFLLCNVLGCD